MLRKNVESRKEEKGAKYEKMKEWRKYEQFDIAVSSKRKRRNQKVQKYEVGYQMREQPGENTTLENSHNDKLSGLTAIRTHKAYA